MPIRVVLVGLGPIGAAVAGQLERRRKAFQIVGAVDIDPSKTGRDAGEVLELGRRMRVKVTDSIGRTIRDTKPDVAVLCTGSTLRQVLPQFEEVLKQRVPIVTTTEQAAYAVRRNARLVRRLDQAARRAKVAVLGTGVNPGFVMDALPIALTGVCERVEKVHIDRIQDARIRRLPFQQKIGAGLTREQFQAKVDDASVRHLFKRWLTAQGYEVVTAEDGDAALASVRQQPPDVVLLDVAMPKMNGIDVCRRIKQDGATRLTPVILVSAVDGLSDRIDGHLVSGHVDGIGRVARITPAGDNHVVEFTVPEIAPETSMSSRKAQVLARTLFRPPVKAPTKPVASVAPKRKKEYT